MNKEKILIILKKRAIFCQEKKYNNADQIRDNLKIHGIFIYDKNPSSGKITGWKIGKKGELNIFYWPKINENLF